MASVTAFSTTVAEAAVLIFVAAWAFASETAVITLICYIVAVAIYGGVTSNPKIILMQGDLEIFTHADMRQRRGAMKEARDVLG